MAGVLSSSDFFKLKKKEFTCTLYIAGLIIPRKLVRLTSHHPLPLFVDPWCGAGYLSLSLSRSVVNGNFIAPPLLQSGSPVSARLRRVGRGNIEIGGAWARRVSWTSKCIHRPMDGWIHLHQSVLSSLEWRERRLGCLFVRFRMPNLSLSHQKQVGLSLSIHSQTGHHPSIRLDSYRHRVAWQDRFQLRDAFAV